MAAQRADYGSFDHPKHGTYESPDHMLRDDRLSETEKQMIIEAWRLSLRRVPADDADAPFVHSVSRSLDGAAARLASGAV